MRKFIYIFVVFWVIIGLSTVVIHNSKKSIITVTPTKYYVALGDSIAAGVGLKTYSDSSACNRTNESYPNQLSLMINYHLSNIACSGTTYDSGILGKQDVNQLFIVSQLNQLFNYSKPDLITITSGANDIDWTGTLAKCYIGTCGTEDDTNVVNQKLQNLGSNINMMLNQIKDHYKNNIPKVVVTGYYQVFPSNGSACMELNGIDTSEILWFRQAQENLNSTISSSVSNFSFAKFAPIDFGNHELCTNDSWLQSINDQQPYHPTDIGQLSIAKQLLPVINSFKMDNLK